MQRWGINYPDRIRVMNPIGFCNSKKVEDSKISTNSFDAKKIITESKNSSGNPPKIMHAKAINPKIQPVITLKIELFIILS